MPKLHSQPLELRIIKTITSTRSQKEAGKIFSSVRDDCFFTRAGRETYARVMTLLKSRAELVTWDELTVDPVLSERVRQKLQVFRKRPIALDQIDKSIKLLVKYRQMRSLLDVSQYIVKELKKDSIDIDITYNTTADMMLNSRSNSSERADWFVHMGMKNDKSSLKLAKKVLQPDTHHYIPTGLKAFDDRNLGIPRGSFFLLAGPTGGGKSALAGQVTENMAMHGARCCIVPLEMDNGEMMQRHLARQSLTSMGKIIDPKSMNHSDRVEVYKTHKLFHRRLEKKGSLLTFFNPQEDMSAEEILFALRPFAYDVILIDYVGLLKGVDGDDQWRAMKKVTRFAKRYASMNDMIVALCAQVSAEGLLRYSRGMAEDASNMWSWQMTEQARINHIVMINQDKSRNQSNFSFPLHFDLEKMYIHDLDEEQQEIYKAARSERKSDKKGRAKSKFGKAKDDNKEKVSKKNSYFDIDDED